MYDRVSMAAMSTNMRGTVQVEVAYDVLLMDNMKRRLSGEAAVAKSVRFADVPKPRKKVQVGVAGQHVVMCLPQALTALHTSVAFFARVLSAAATVAGWPDSRAAPQQPGAGHAVGGLWRAGRVDFGAGQADVQAAWHNLGCQAESYSQLRSRQALCCPQQCSITMC
jgi:Protein CHAPERONE-LIKE PROTEIN OF POR1-like